MYPKLPDLFLFPKYEFILEFDKMMTDGLKYKTEQSLALVIASIGRIHIILQPPVLIPNAKY